VQQMDKYDFVILDIIQTFRKNNKNQYIKLNQLEANFWTRIQRDAAHQMQSTQLGERVTKLYLNGFIVNKSGLGYTLTKKGKEELIHTTIE
jgi:predicted transcriptional regulator